MCLLRGTDWIFKLLMYYSYQLQDGCQYAAQNYFFLFYFYFCFSFSPIIFLSHLTTICATKNEIVANFSFLLCASAVLFLFEFCYVDLRYTYNSSNADWLKWVFLPQNTSSTRRHFMWAALITPNAVCSLFLWWLSVHRERPFSVAAISPANRAFYTFRETQRFVNLFTIDSNLHPLLNTSVYLNDILLFRRSQNMNYKDKCYLVHTTRAHEPLEVKLLLCLTLALDEVTG